MKNQTSDLRPQTSDLKKALIYAIVAAWFMAVVASIVSILISI